MPTIKVLPTHLVNKIAAGEVIERPASVVKELIENALDAGATQVDVTIEKGGKQLIAVTDNGRGMDADDLGKAFAPHATSKIATDEDLFRIGTLGFRGEALASIASISHAHMRSRTADEDSGYEIEASGDTLGEVRPCAAAAGTTITIRDLFFNTPARRKFLKADSTEMGHISEAVTRIALPNRRVAFTAMHNGRRVLDLPATESLTQRVADLFDADLAADLLTVVPDTDRVKVTGLVGPPAAGRATTRWQYFFLNGRYIRDRFCQHALREAYRGLIDPHRQPVAILFIEVAPEDVDINVHPTKIEVRFRDGQSVHSHILAAIRQTLQQAEIRPRAQIPEGAEIGSGEMPDDPRRQGLREALAEFFASRPAAQSQLQFPGRHDRPEAGRRAPQASRPTPASPPAGIRPAGDPPSVTPFSPPVPASEPPSPAHDDGADRDAPEARQIMQVHNTYLVVASADGLLIADQHALHERILYDRLLKRITGGPLESQGLLLPATITVNAIQRGLLDEHAELLGALGIEVADFGPDTVAVQRFPSLLDKVDPAAFLTDVLDHLAAGDPSLAREHLLHALLEMMACKAAIKAGDPLSDEEMRQLLAAADGVDKSTACPHGRPTQIRVTLRDLERQFKRQ